MRWNSHLLNLSLTSFFFPFLLGYPQLPDLTCAPLLLLSGGVAATVFKVIYPYYEQTLLSPPSHYASLIEIYARLVALPSNHPRADVPFFGM